MKKEKKTKKNKDMHSCYRFEELVDQLHRHSMSGMLTSFFF